MTFTWPFESLFHLSATSFSTRNHDELVGTEVAILMVMTLVWADGAEGTRTAAARRAIATTHAVRPTRRRFSLDIMMRCSP